MHLFEKAVEPVVVEEEEWQQSWQVADISAYTDTELKGQPFECESEAVLDKYSVKLDCTAAQVLDTVAAGDGKEPGNYKNLMLEEKGRVVEHMQLWSGMNTATLRLGVEEVMWA